MNHESGSQPTSEPSPASPFFTMPPASSRQLVPYAAPSLPEAVTRPAASPASPDASTTVGGEVPLKPSPPPAGGPDLVGQIQQRTAEHERLLGLCQSLRATHRCPGECVLSAARHERLLWEIGQGGVP